MPSTPSAFVPGASSLALTLCAPPVLLAPTGVGAPPPRRPGRLLHSPGRGVLASYLSDQAGTLRRDMAALREALMNTNGLREARKPPGLRQAAGRDRCATCAWWKRKALTGDGGVCRLYASYPTRADQISNAFKKGS